MSFSLTIHSEYIEMFPDPDLNSSRSGVALSVACRSLVKACKEHHLRRALARVNTPLGKVGVLELFETARYLAESISGLHLAIVVGADESEEMKDFFQLAGANRGLRIEFFADHDSASQWLVGLSA